MYTNTYAYRHTDIPGKRHTCVNEATMCLSVFAVSSQIHTGVIYRVLLMALVSSIFRSEEIISQKSFSLYPMGVNCSLFCRCIKSLGKSLVRKVPLSPY
jgi:hypothetical protein